MVEFRRHLNPALNKLVLYVRIALECPYRWDTAQAADLTRLQLELLIGRSFMSRKPIRVESMLCDADSDSCMAGQWGGGLHEGLNKVATGGCNCIGVADKVSVTRRSASCPGVKQRFASVVPFRFR